MGKIVLCFMLTGLFLQGQDIVIVADKNFPVNYLNKEELSAYFLNKKSYIQNKKVLVMNYPYGNSIRTCFETLIFQKSKNTLQRYWRRAYYHGRRPPKVIESREMMFSYLQKVTPSLGYMSAKYVDTQKVKVLYKGTCL